MLHKLLPPFHLIIACCIALALIKIYQNNLIIGLNYELGRLEKQCRGLAKERNELFAKISQINAPEIVMANAQKKLAMMPHAVDRVIILNPEKAKFNFIGTAATSQIIEALNLVEHTISGTGENHART